MHLVEYARAEGYSGDWDGMCEVLLDAGRALRRKLTASELSALSVDLREILQKVQSVIADPVIETENMSGNDAENERHYHNSKPDPIDLEPAEKISEGGTGTAPPAPPRLPLGLVVRACPDIEPYAPDGLHNWHQLAGAAAFARGMMGISQSAWDEAQMVMGVEVTAITVAAILQRFAMINSPGGYLRALTAKAKAGEFSPGPMIMALL